jgi:hypothetical protein
VLRTPEPVATRVRKALEPAGAKKK